MSSPDDLAVRGLLEPANYAVISTLNADGSIHSAVVWISLEGDELAVNTAVGRAWPNNLERNPRTTVVVYPGDSPNEYVEIRGTAAGTLDDADDHIDRLAKLYLNQDKYPFRQPGEQRIKYVITPQRVRYRKQG